MATSVDSLSIQISASTTDAKRKVDELCTSLNALATAIASIDTSKFDALAGSVDTLSQGLGTLKGTGVRQIQKVAQALHDVNTEGRTALEPAIQSTEQLSVEAGKAAQSEEQVVGAIKKLDATPLEDVSASIGRVSDSLSVTSSKMSTFKNFLAGLKIIIPTEGLENVNKKIDKLTNKIADLRDKLNYNSQINPDYVDSAEMEKDQAQIQGLINELDRLKLKKQELESHGGFKFGLDLSAGLNNVRSSLSSVISKMGSFITHLFKARSSTRDTTKSFNGFSLSAGKLAKELFRVGKMLKLMVTRMALRAVIKEVGNGFKSLALHSEEFNSSMSALINSSKKLGYSFAGMVGPLINALAPALVYIISLITKLLNAINQIFSALSGKGSWNKAKDFTNNWADDIEAANKQAKELKKTVLGFDELNQLQKKETSGGDTSNNITDMFETVPIDSKWKNIADWLKKMWEIGDFTELGAKLGKKLRDMLESIPWDLIRKTSNKLGKSLATLINGFVEVERLGYDIGKTIAQSVNTVFEFINGFVHNLHWDSIGKFIADTFNGFFENIDWVLIKDTVITGMAGLAESIQTFIEEFRWDNISSFIINAVDTISSGIKTFVDGIDWLDLGKKIGDQLNKTISGIDWRDVGDTLGAVLEAIIDWAFGLVDTFSVDDTVKALEDLLSGICDRVNFEKAGETLGTALHKIIEVIQKFWRNQENRDKVKQAIVDFFKGIFGSMTASDFGFIATSAGALALLSATRGILTKSALTLTISVAVAYVGFNIGSWLGKIITGDEAYDQYTLPVILEFTVENLPKSWDDFVDKVNEMADAWYKMCTEANTFIRILAILVGGPFSGMVISAGKLRDLADGIANSDTYKEAQKSASSYQGQLEQLIDDYQLGIVTQAEFNKKYEELADKAAKAGEELGKANQSLYGPQGWIFQDGAMAQSLDAYANKAEESTKKTQDLKDSMDKTKSSVKDCASDVKDLTEKKKELKNIIQPVNLDMAKLKEASGNLSTGYKNLKGDTENLNKVIKDSQTAYKNYKGSQDEVVSTAPKLTKAQQDIENSLKNLETENDKFTASNKTTWQEFDLETANAELGFSGTVNTIQKDMTDCTTDLKKQADDVGKAFTKDKWTFDGVADGMKKTFEKAKESIKGVWNSIADKLNGEHSFGESKFRINLPKFYASGGFPEDGWFRASHGELMGRFDNGQTVVANNEQIIEGISKGVYSAVSAAMSKNSNGNAGYIANTIVVDGEVIARTVTKAQNRQNMRYSPTMG